MTYSKRHLAFSELFPSVLTHPEEFIGRNWKNVLNIWIYLDTLNSAQLSQINSICYRPYYDYKYTTLLNQYSRQECEYSSDIFNLTPSGFDYLVLELIAEKELMENQIPLRYLPNLCNYMTLFKPSIVGSNSLQP
jgi:hypothetical protein